MAPTIDTIRDCLGDLIFGEEDDELQHAVCRLLRERGQSLATCEWGSGGTVAHWLRDVPDGESVLAGGVVVRDAASASQLLGVDARLEVREHVRELAVAVRRQLGADYGLAVGAFPDLAADLEAKVYLGLATPQEAVVAGRRFAGHPRILKARAAKQALDLIRLHLLKSA
jgi:nicotinamide-nucleotide amidase